MSGAVGALGKSSMSGRLFGATEAALRSTTFHLYPVDRLEYGRNMDAISAALGEAAWAAALSEGAAMSLDEAAALVLQLDQR